MRRVISVPSLSGHLRRGPPSPGLARGFGSALPASAHASPRAQDGLPASPASSSRSKRIIPLDAVTPETPDIAVIEAVEALLDGSDAPLLARLSSLPGGITTLTSIFMRIASSSPHAFPALFSLRARVGKALADKDTPPVKRDAYKKIDTAIVHVLQIISGPTFLRSVQLSLSASASPIIQGLTAAARSAERVRKMDGDGDFMLRFGGGRMVHGMYHVGMVDDTDSPPPLLAVLYSASVPSLPTSLEEIDQETGRGARSRFGGATEAGEPWKAWETPSTSPPHPALVFYSVSSPHHGFRGLKMGTRIIYEVAGTIARRCPEIRTFGTLSPVPEFMEWLKRLQSGGRLDEVVGHTALPGGGGGEGMRTAILEAWREAQAALPSLSQPGGGSVGAGDALVSLLASGVSGGDGGVTWYSLPRVRSMLAPVLVGLVRRYLLTPTSPAVSATPLCKVAGFHLGNGARLARISFGADPSPAGLAQSGSVMVNYLYSGSISSGEGREAPSSDPRGAGGLEGLDYTMREGASRYVSGPSRILAEQDPLFEFRI